MAQPGSRLLTIEGLVVEGYQDEAWRRIVDGVSLRLDRGEVLGLIGESGAGKSTVGIAAMGYVRAGCRIVAGRGAFDGEELSTASDRALRRLRGVRIAFVAQIADRIMVLRHGRVVEEGATRALLASPREDYTRALLAVRKTRADKVEHAAGGPVLLEVDGITASYASGLPVLQEVSLTVAKGDTVAVVGESGSGKSTLARVIVGLLAPAQGRIRFSGEIVAPSCRRRARETLRRIQMVSQMPDVALNPRHKVRDILARPLVFYFGMDAQARRERVAELLAMIELGEGYADRFPS